MIHQAAWSNAQKRAEASASARFHSDTEVYEAGPATTTVFACTTVLFTPAILKRAMWRTEMFSPSPEQKLRAARDVGLRQTAAAIHAEHSSDPGAQQRERGRLGDCRNAGRERGRDGAAQAGGIRRGSAVHREIGALSHFPRNESITIIFQRRVPTQVTADELSVAGVEGRGACGLPEAGGLDEGVVEGTAVITGRDVELDDELLVEAPVGYLYGILVMIGIVSGGHDSGIGHITIGRAGKPEIGDVRARCAKRSTHRHVERSSVSKSDDVVPGTRGGRTHSGGVRQRRRSERQTKSQRNCGNTGAVRHESS